MQKLLIKGKKELSGTILISGSKNASLPILAAFRLPKKLNSQRTTSKRYFYNVRIIKIYWSQNKN